MRDERVLPEGTGHRRRDSRAIQRRRERLFARWDANGGPDPLLRWWLAAPWRWGLAGAIVLGGVAGFFALTGSAFPDRLWLMAPFVVGGLALTAGLHDEWLACRHPDGEDPAAVPSLSRRLTVASQMVLGLSLLAFVILSVNASPAPNEDAIAEALFGAETSLQLLADDEPATDPTEVSVLERAEWDWVVATRGESGRCYVYRFEQGEVVQRGRAPDPTDGCTAEVAAAQLDDSSA